MIPFRNIKTQLQRVGALAVTLCVVILFSQTAVAQDTIKPYVIKTGEGNSSVKVNKQKNNAAKALHRSGQRPVTKETVKKDSTSDSLAADSLSAVPQHSPTKAMWMSAVLPGLGQVYNKQAWKIPIIYAGAAGVTYFAITNYQGREKFKNELIKVFVHNQSVLE